MLASGVSSSVNAGWVTPPIDALRNMPNASDTSHGSLLRVENATSLGAWRWEARKVLGSGAWERGSKRVGAHRYFSMMSEFRASSIDLRLGVLRGISHSSQGATAVGVPLFSLSSGSLLRTA
jgi:hypothetical protein